MPDQHVRLSTHNTNTTRYRRELRVDVVRRARGQGDGLNVESFVLGHSSLRECIYLNTWDWVGVVTGPRPLAPGMCDLLNCVNHCGQDGAVAQTEHPVSALAHRFWHDALDVLRAESYVVGLRLIEPRLNSVAVKDGLQLEHVREPAREWTDVALGALIGNGSGVVIVLYSALIQAVSDILGTVIAGTTDISGTKKFVDTVMLGLKTYGLIVNVPEPVKSCELIPTVRWLVVSC